MNVFSNLQQAVIGRLTASDTKYPSLTPVNNQINWITEDIGDLANIVTKTVGTLGIIGIVMTPGGGKMYSLDHDLPAGFVCPIEIQIQENVTVNRGAAGTQVPALDLVQFCMQRVHRFSPTNQRLNRIYLEETPFLLVSEVPLLVYNVRFAAPVTIP